MLEAGPEKLVQNQQVASAVAFLQHRVAFLQQEFGEPAAELLAGLAAMGCSRREAIGALGWHPCRAGRIVAALDPEGRIRWPGPNQSRARRLSHRRSPADAVRRHRRGPGAWRLAQVEVPGVGQVPRIELFERHAHPGLTLSAFAWRLAHGWPLCRALHTPPSRRES
jgi:hypothetical protein